MKRKLRTPIQYSHVTIEDNETAEKWSGQILEYTPERIVIRNKITPEGSAKIAETTILTFDAKKVNFV